VVPGEEVSLEVPNMKLPRGKSAPWRLFVFKEIFRDKRINKAFSHLLTPFRKGEKL